MRSRLPQGVKLRRGWRATKCPVSTQNRTHAGRVDLSHMCQKPTPAWWPLEFRDDYSGNPALRRPSTNLSRAAMSR